MSEQLPHDTSTQSAPIVPGVSPVSPALDDRSITLLTQECDRMLTLYNATQAGAQSVFNFYLTFVTAVVAGLIFLGGDAGANPLTIAGVLLFSAMVGTVYLSALAGRYAHAARYAGAVDALRHALFEQVTAGMPPQYRDFTAFVNGSGMAPQTSVLAWLFPHGTYTLFISVINSFAMAAMAYIASVDFGVPDGRALIGAVVIVAVVLTIQNAYVRLVVERLRQRFGVRVDMGDDMGLWASRT